MARKKGVANFGAFKKGGGRRKPKTKRR